MFRNVLWLLNFKIPIHIKIMPNSLSTFQISMACQIVPEDECLCHIGNASKIAPGNFSSEVAIIKHINFIGIHKPECQLTHTVVHWWKMECNRKGIHDAGAPAMIFLICACVILIAFVAMLLHKLNKANKRSRADAAGSTS